jgi:cyanophycinase
MKLWVLMVCCALASLANAQGWICAEGGGTGSGPWAAEMYGWMVEKGGNGHVVLLGAVELDDKPDPREAAFVKAGAKSARSLVITAANADTQETFDAINEATIIFIRGGSQSRYVEWWKGTKTEAAIRAVFARGGVVGGTSAGCAILGEVSYDARNGSLRPEEIVKDARHPDVTLTKDFLGLVPGVLFDTHFGERARLPRLAVMLGHCREDLQVEPIGIGLDPKTALCVGPDGMAEVRGEGYATFLELTLGTRTRLDAGKPPVVTPMLMTVVPKGARINLRTRAFVSERTVSSFPYVAQRPTVLKDAYAKPRESMEQAVRSFGQDAYLRVSTVVMVTPGVEAIAADSSVSLSGKADQPPASSVVVEHSGRREWFTQAGLGSPWQPMQWDYELHVAGPETIEFVKQQVASAHPDLTWDQYLARYRENQEKYVRSVYRARLHILPPGWILDLGEGVATHVTGLP